MNTSFQTDPSTIFFSLSLIPFFKTVNQSWVFEPNLYKKKMLAYFIGNVQQGKYSTLMQNCNISLSGEDKGQSGNVL
jgi:hypothetical protein